MNCTGSTTHNQHIPKVLSIAGSDCSGGAGVQADIKTFCELDVYSSSVLTCITAQNQYGLSMLEAVSSEVLNAQLDALLEPISFDAIKIGMLCSAEQLNIISKRLKGLSCPIIIDPILGPSLHNEQSANYSQPPRPNPKSIISTRPSLIWREYLSRATLITPNIKEALFLLENSASEHEQFMLSIEQMQALCIELNKMLNTSILLKGGHLLSDTCTDVLYHQGQFSLYSQKKIDTQNTHGTGCTLSSAICAYMAHGLTLNHAVERAIRFTANAIEQGIKLSLYPNGYGPVNPLGAADDRLIKTKKP